VDLDKCAFSLKFGEVQIKDRKEKGGRKIESAS
jgi:hypothetical protein